MIFAELEYEEEYGEFHQELYSYLVMNFSKIECGLQGDSWFWIFCGNEKVAIDTFSSMKHQIKSRTTPKSNFYYFIIRFKHYLIIILNYMVIVS